MANEDILPAADQDFDTLQAIIVAAVTLNAAAWNIPAGEITKLTTAQTLWASTWAIAKDKQNSTSAQKKAKDLARKSYEKVLRPFIQKWIYRNESMDASDVEECGLKPRDTTHTKVTKPDAPVVKLKRGVANELVSTCAAVPKAKHYGAILVGSAPLPAGIVITPDGKLVFPVNDDPNPNPQPKITALLLDLNDQREKHFPGLTAGTTYYVYYYAVNAAGVSALSNVVSLVCW